MKIKDLRKSIDGFDERIIKLLNQRARRALEIRRLKLKGKGGVYAPDREKEVYKKVTGLNKGPLSGDSLIAIYREIMSAALALERSLAVAYPGPPASFTHLAALKKFGSSVNYLPVNSIADVFRGIERGEADYGVVPIENSIEGAVNDTLDMFMESDLKVCSEVSLEICHNITRFLVISRDEVKPTGEDKTSIMFSLKDKAGALYSMLEPFKKNGINLTRIESRPSKKKTRDYYFFIDMLGHHRDSNVARALKELEKQSAYLKILGSYPMEC